MALMDPAETRPRPTARDALERPLTLDAAAAPERPPSRIDAWMSEIRLRHVVCLAVFLSVGALVWAAPGLTLLPPYLALVALEPTRRLQARYGLSFGAAAALVVAGAFFVIVASALTLLLPLVLQALRIDAAAAVAGIAPAAEAALAWARAAAAEVGVDFDALAAEVDVEAELRSFAFGDGAGAALAIGEHLLAPLKWLALTLLIVFMAAYALGYSAKLRGELRRFLRILTPVSTARTVERLAANTQRAGSAVFRGYGAMVVVLGGFYFISYLGAVAFFPEARALPPAMVVALVVLTALIGAVPGLGAKLLLAVGAVAGVAVGAATYAYTGSVALGLYIFAAMVLITGFESKFGTPNTLGRALGVNSVLILFLAIATVAAFGVIATLWAVFVALPILVAGVRTLVELEGEPPVEPADQIIG